MNLLFNPKNTKYLFIEGESEEMDMLEKHMNKIPQYQLLPTFKGIPKPEIFLDSFTSKTGRKIYYCSMGLWREVVTFCEAKKFTCNTIPQDIKLTEFDMDRAEFKRYIATWDLNLELRDYQIDAAWLILKYRRSLSELATRSGKTLIMYVVCRAAMELLDVHNILVIVPSIHLVKQGVQDMKEYKEFFETETIWANGEQIESANMTIGTFQSLVLKADPLKSKYDPEFFNKYDMVIVDECHKLPCKSIKSILGLDFTNKVKIQFGFTGTLPKKNTIEWLCCQAMMGPKIQEISARELIDEGYLAEPIIKQIRIKYPEDDYIDTAIECAEYLLGIYEIVDGKKVSLETKDFTMIHKKVLPDAIQQIKSIKDKMTYCDYLVKMLNNSSKTLMWEQMLAQRSGARIDVIDNIVHGIRKNIIVFAHNTEYINYLADHLKKQHPYKKIYKITGGTNLKKRQKIIDEMLETDDAVLVGSFGAVATGLTFKRLNYAIFAQSFKSEIITKQSLGRAMLLEPGKNFFHLYDIIDVFSQKKIYSQGLAKIRTYKEEGYEFDINDLTLPYKRIYSNK